MAKVQDACVFTILFSDAPIWVYFIDTSSDVVVADDDNSDGVLIQESIEFFRFVSPCSFHWLADSGI